MILDTVDVKKKGVHTRYLILLIIFIVTAVNYADRATLSIAGTEVAKGRIPSVPVLRWEGCRT